MHLFSFRFISTLMIGFSLLFLPAAVQAQGYPDSPPIAQALVREGTLAVELQSGMNLGTSSIESVAEEHLARAGIAPVSGWNSDEAVTPEIIGQIQDSIIHATENGWIPMGRKEALDRFRAVASGLNLPVKPYAGQTGTGEYARSYSDQADLDSYYAQEGPPMITYYTPPPDYYGMYTWVPYPFWWYGVPFSGYYILNGPVIVGHGHGFHRHHDHHGFRGDRDNDRDDHAGSGLHAAAQAPGVPVMVPQGTDPAGAEASKAGTAPHVTTNAASAGSQTGRVHHDLSRGTGVHRHTPEVPHQSPVFSHAAGVPTIESRPPAIPNARMTPPSSPGNGVSVNHPEHPSGAGHIGERGPATGHPGGIGGMHGGFHGGIHR